MLELILPFLTMKLVQKQEQDDFFGKGVFLEYVLTLGPTVFLLTVMKDVQNETFLSSTCRSHYDGELIQIQPRPQQPSQKPAAHGTHNDTCMH